MDVPNITLNDGNAIPQLGYGVWRIGNEETVAAVSSALEVGYRHIDTAAIYGNETGVGQAIRQSGVARGDVFLTTKLWNAGQGFDATLKACEESLTRLGTDYVDLYLIHWPMPERDLFVDSWRAMIRLREEGRVRSIGVSNFRIADLERLLSASDVPPVLNQIELHPQFQQADARRFQKVHNIQTEAWGPLGQGKLLESPELKVIADRHGRSIAQIILRWHLQIGNIAIPKSVTPSRMRDNFTVFDFELTEADIEAITRMDRPEDGRIGRDPGTFNALNI